MCPRTGRRSARPARDSAERLDVPRPAPRGIHDLQRPRAQSSLHPARVRGHQPTLRPGFSAQIRSQRARNPLVSQTTLPATHDREPSQDSGGHIPYRSIGGRRLHGPLPPSRPRCSSRHRHGRPVRRYFRLAVVGRRTNGTNASSISRRVSSAGVHDKPVPAVFVGAGMGSCSDGSEVGNDGSMPRSGRRSERGHSSPRLRAGPPR